MNECRPAVSSFRCVNCRCYVSYRPWTVHEPMIDDMDNLARSAMSPQEIERLCQRSIGGDAAALERLLWEHHPHLLSFARRKVGMDWQGKFDPEDILQEAYIQIFADIAGFQYDGEDSFLRWAVRIVEHRFIDQVRRMRSLKRDVARESAPRAGEESRYGGFLARCFPDLNTPSLALSREDAQSAIVMCLARLPDHYRQVVQRFYLDEEPLAKIAADMHRSEDAVRRMASRALEQLEVCLGRASSFLRSRS